METESFVVVQETLQVSVTPKHHTIGVGADLKSALFDTKVAAIDIGESRVRKNETRRLLAYLELLLTG